MRVDVENSKSMPSLSAKVSQLEDLKNMEKSSDSSDSVVLILSDERNEYTFYDLDLGESDTQTYFDGAEQIAVLTVENNQLTLHSYTDKQINISADVQTEGFSIRAKGDVCLNSQFVGTKFIEISAQSICVANKLSLPKSQIVLSAIENIEVLGGINVKQMTLLAYRCLLQKHISIRKKLFLRVQNLVLGGREVKSTVFLRGESYIFANRCLLHDDTQVTLLKSKEASFSRFEIAESLNLGRLTVLELVGVMFKVKNIYNHGELSLIRTALVAKGVRNDGFFIAKKSRISADNFTTRDRLASTEISNSQVMCLELVLIGGRFSLCETQFRGKGAYCYDGKFLLTEKSKLYLSDLLKVDIGVNFTCDQSSLELNSSIIFSDNVCLTNCFFQGDDTIFYGASDISYTTMNAGRLMFTSPKSYLKHCQIKADFLDLWVKKSASHLCFEKCNILVKKFSEDSNVTLLGTVINGLEDEEQSHKIRGSFNLVQSQFKTSGELYANEQSHVSLDRSSVIQSSQYCAKSKTIINQSQLLTDELFNFGGVFKVTESYVRVSNNFLSFKGTVSYAKGTVIDVQNNYTVGSITVLSQSKITTKNLSVQNVLNLRDKSFTEVKNSLEGSYSSVLHVEESAVLTKDFDFVGTLKGNKSYIKVEDRFVMPIVSKCHLTGAEGIFIEANQAVLQGTVENIVPQGENKLLENKESKADKLEKPIMSCLQVKAKERLKIGLWAKIKGDLNLVADAKRVDQQGRVEVSGNCLLKGEKFNQDGYLRAKLIFLGFDKYIIYRGTLVSEELIAQSRFILSLYSKNCVKKRYLASAIIDSGIGLTLANNYTSSSFISTGLRLTIPNFSADKKYIFSSVNLISSMRSILTAFFPHFAPAIGLVFMAPVLTRLLSSMGGQLYNMYKNGLPDLKGTRWHETVGGINAVKNLALFGYSIAKTIAGLGGPLPNMIMPLDAEHIAETTGCAIGAFAGSRCNTSLVDINAGMNLATSGSSSSVVYFNSGLDADILFQRVDTIYGENLGVMAGLNASYVAHDLYNRGEIYGFERFYLEINNFQNSSSGTVSGSGVNADIHRLRQQGQLSFSNGSVKINHLHDSHKAHTQLSHMQAHVNEGELTSELNLTNHSVLSAENLHFAKQATERVQDSVISSNHLIDESNMQCRGTVIVDAPDYSHTGSISQTDEAGAQFILRTKTPHLSGSANVDRAVFIIDHCADAEQMIDGTGAYANYHFSKGFTLESKDDLVLLHDIHRHGDITIVGNSIVDKVDQHGLGVLTLVSTQGDVDLESNVETKSLLVKSAHDIYVDKTIKEKDNVQFQADGTCSLVGAKVKGHDVLIEAGTINNDLGVGSGGREVGGVVHADHFAVLHATKGNVTNHGQITSDKYTEVTATGKVLNLATEHSHRNQYGSVQKKYHAGVISGGDGSETNGVGLYVSADDEVIGDASIFSSHANNIISGANGVRFGYHSSTYISHEEHYNYGFLHSKHKDIVDWNTDISASTVSTDGGRNIIISKNGTVVSYGANCLAPGGTDIYAKNEVLLYSVRGTSVHNVRSDHLWGASTHKYHDVSESLKPTVVVDNGTSRIHAEFVDAQGAYFGGSGDLEIEASKTIVLGGESLHYSKWSQTVDYTFMVGFSQQQDESRVSFAISRSEVETSTQAEVLSRASGINRGGSVKLKAGKSVILNNGVKVHAGGDLDVDTPELDAHAASLHSETKKTSDYEGVAMLDHHLNVGAFGERSSTSTINNVDAELSCGGEMKLHHGDKAVDKVVLDGAEIRAKTIDGNVKNLSITDHQDKVSSSSDIIGANTRGGAWYGHCHGESQTTQHHAGIYVSSAQATGEHKLTVENAKMTGGEMKVPGKDTLQVDKLDASTLQDVSVANGLVVGENFGGMDRHGLPVIAEDPVIDVDITHSHSQSQDIPIVTGSVEDELNIKTVNGSIMRSEQAQNSPYFNEGERIHVTLPIHFNKEKIGDDEAFRVAFENTADADVAARNLESSVKPLEVASPTNDASQAEETQSVFNQPATLFVTSPRNTGQMSSRNTGEMESKLSQTDSDLPDLIPIDDFDSQPRRIVDTGTMSVAPELEQKYYDTVPVDTGRQSCVSDLSPYALPETGMEIPCSDQQVQIYQPGGMYDTGTMSVSPELVQRYDYFQGDVSAPVYNEDEYATIRPYNPTGMDELKEIWLHNSYSFEQKVRFTVRWLFDGDELVWNDTLRSGYTGDATVSDELLGLGKCVVNSASDALDVLTGGPSGLAPQLEIKPEEREGALAYKILSVASLFVVRTGAGAEASNLSRMEYLTQKYGSLTSSERMARIDQLSMYNYERRAWELINQNGYANRYLSEGGLKASRRFGTVRGYSTTIDSDSSLEVSRGAQIKSEWGTPRYRTIIPADSITNIRIPRPLGDTGSYGWEFFTNSYPEAGPGGWPQFIIDDVNLEDVQITELKP